MKIEVVTFQCASCGKRSTVPVENETITCKHCGGVFVRLDGDDEKWYSKKYLDWKKRKENEDAD